MELAENYRGAHFPEPAHYAVAVPIFFGLERSRIRVVTRVVPPHPKGVVMPPNLQVDTPVGELIPYPQRLTAPDPLDSVFNVPRKQALPPT